MDNVQILNEKETDKEKAARRFEDGFKSWRKFCDLMDKHPNMSFEQLNELSNA